MGSSEPRSQPNIVGFNCRKHWLLGMHSKALEVTLIWIKLDIKEKRIEGVKWTCLLLLILRIWPQMLMLSAHELKFKCWNGSITCCFHPVTVAYWLSIIWFFLLFSKTFIASNMLFEYVICMYLRYLTFCSRYKVLSQFFFETFCNYLNKLRF